ncbi:CHAT domain-containing protein [Suillus lakei]|nr:CHAT domain-containing protein [Suillus lakei]
MDHNKHVFALEVLNGTNLITPSHRVPAGLYVLVSTSSGQWNTTIAAPMADCSVAWNETLIMHWCPPKSSSTSTVVHFEIYASFEFGQTLGRGQLVGTVKTTLEELLKHDKQFQVSFPAIYNQHPSLLLRMKRMETPHLTGSTADSAQESEVGRVTDAAHEAYALYSKTNHRDDLDRTIQDFQAVLEQCPNGHPDRAAALTNLAHAIIFGTTKNIGTDIDHAISHFRSALALRPIGHPDRPLSIFNLYQALHQRHLSRDDFADIREAAELYSSLLPLCVEGSYLHRVVLDDDGVQYVIEEYNALPCSTMDESISLRWKILELCPPGHPRRAWSLSILAADLCGRFHQSGDVVDIDEAVRLSRNALTICPADAGRDFYLGVLCYALQLRFDRHGDPSDLNESISLYRAALNLCPPFDPARWTSLNNLAEALNARYNQHGNISDFEEALRIHGEALDLRPRGHAGCDHTLNNLAATLYTHFEKSRDISALDDAIRFYREALEMRPPGHQLHCQALLNLASALQKRFTHTRNGEHIEEAIKHCQEALRSLSSEAYMARYDVHCDIDDLARAFENYELAVKHRTQSFPQRIAKPVQWITDAEKYNHGSALDAYQTLLHLLDIRLSTRSSMISRREAVSQLLAPALSANIASFAIRRGELATAVELLERGRALLWSQVSRLRTAPDQLRIARPLLADQFAALSEDLSVATYGHGSDFVVADSAVAEHYRRLLKQWEAVVAQIRGIDRFSRFLLPPSYDDARLAAQDGPIILLIASEYSCHSLIITRNSEQPHHVLLSLTLADLQDLKKDFAEAIQQAIVMRPTQPRMELRSLLQKVWDKVMLPIVNPRSRIWLCPSAAFTSIPLHAAHPFRMKADRSGLEPCLEDIYICSYTPTLSALIRARQTMRTRVAPSFMAAGRGTVLLGARAELDLVFRLDRAQPYNSFFVMKDKPVTLLDIIENDFPKAEFAFLSSCQTAVGNEQTPDEVMHLAAGLLFSGFKSVIGTLSVVDDNVANEIVQAFYENMFTDGVMDCTMAASALNTAIRAVKNQVPLEQSIIFIHIGV